MRLRSLPGRWRTFQNLTLEDRRLVAKAGAYLPFIGAMLRILGFARSQSLLSALTAPSSSASPATHPLEVARATATMIRLAAERGPYHATCLPQSLLLWLLLRRQGIETAVRVGVRKIGGQVEAHAWVEHCGIAINDDEDVHDRFRPFDRVIVQ